MRVERARFHGMRREFGGACADLEEAREIAKQGEIGLHLADDHLEAARLHIPVVI